MSEILVMDPEDADNVEAVVADNASDRGEDEWTINHTSEEDGRLFVKVTWGSETDQVFYIEERESTTDDDRFRLEDMLDHYNFKYERTDAGNWRILRGGYE